MLRGRLAATSLVALVSAACSAGTGGGRLVVERQTKGSGRMLDDSARAIYCPAESLLTVVAVGRNWSGGLALRVALPVRSPVTLRVQRTLNGPGTAAAAFRPMSGVARFGVGGTVTLAPSSAIDGEFEISVTDSTPPDAVLRGKLSHIAYVVPSGAPCHK